MILPRAGWTVVGGTKVVFDQGPGSEAERFPKLVAAPASEPVPPVARRRKLNFRTSKGTLNQPVLKP